MTDGVYKETAPQINESLETLGLPNLVSQMIRYSDFIANLDIQTSKEQGFWKIEHWISRDSILTILISNEDENVGFEINIVEGNNRIQKRRVTVIKMGREDRNPERTELDLIEVNTEDLLDPNIILSSDQNPNDLQP
jgi:hypothetical protein